MDADAGGQALRGPFADELRPLVDEIRGLSQRSTWSLNDVELLDAIRAALLVQAAADSLKLSLLAGLDARPEAVAGAAPGKAAFTFLTEALRVSRGQAHRDVRAAGAVVEGGSMPALGAAFAAGEISREHVDVAVSAIEKLPAAIKKLVAEDGTTGRQVLDRLVTEQAKAGPPGTVTQLGQDLLSVLDPERAAKLDEDAVQRRTGSHSVDYLGMHLFSFVTDPVTGVQLMAILTEFAKPLPAGPGEGQDGQEVLFADPRTHAQRFMDAFADAVRIAAGTRLHHPDGADDGDDLDEAADGSAEGGADEGVEGRKCGCRGGRARTWWGAPAPRVAAELLVFTSVDQLAAAHGVKDAAAGAAGLAQGSLAGRSGDWPGSTLDPTTLARLSCDAVLRKVLLAENGAVLDLGRSRRLASPGQRKGLAGRDLGCVIPGCGIPAEWCDVHHVIPWSEGGSTDVEGRCLLCPRHHTAVHARIWEITMNSGVPWVKPPGWVDARRRWFRNTTHEHRHRARRTAQHLARQLQLPLTG